MLSIRKIGALGRTYRHLNRYSQILGIFIKYGFGDLIERLNIDQYIEIGMQMISSGKGSAYYKVSRPERIRMAMEELGPAYVKLGQLLSTRSDLLPMPFIDAFSRLQENVSPIPFAEAAKVIRKELGEAPEKIFREFGREPIASASIGQVHRAELPEGDIVAVKIQRPGIRRTIEADLEIMLHLAMLMENNIEEFALHRPVRIVEEFSNILEKELDYNNEAANMERFGRQFFDEPGIFVPKVFRDFCSERVLCMDYVRGSKISKIHSSSKSGVNKKKIVRLGADIFLRQIFDHGFFHADPHPGNIRILENNVICLLDFGMMGNIDRYTRGDFVELIYNAVRADEVRTTKALLKITDRGEKDCDIRILERDVADFIGSYLHKPLKDIEITGLLRQLLELSSRHHLRIPPGIFLMLKSLSTIEGIARELDPDFDFTSRVVPFVKREKMERFRPDRLAEEMLHISGDILQFIRRFPGEVLEIIRLIKKQRFSVQFEHRGLESMLETHERISNKLAFAIIIASLIIGSAIVIIAKIPPIVYGISLIGIIVFTAAAVMGVWLLIAIMRRGKF